MASISFPYDLATVRAGNFNAGYADNVSRTTFESRKTEQKQITSRPGRVFRATIDVPDANRRAFEDWAELNAHRLFNFRIPGEASDRELRVQGGVGGVNLVRAEDRMNGLPYWTTTVVLESA